MRYILIGGSFQYYDDWYQTDSGLFTSFMARRGFQRIDPPYRWNGGVTVTDWRASADALGWYLRGVDFADRNVIAYSNGGQPVLCLCARGIEIRTLTTVGTPVRSDVPTERAEAAIRYHQAIYDELDPIRWIGEIDGSFGKRRFDRARNYNLRDISHGRVFFDERYVSFWDSMGWLEAIRELQTPAEDASSTVE